ncbi:MAG: hypothetical protein LBV41_05980 [Cytophagaceae bacterium]|jgi:hypothetical protein|nr:hypothetical protein [Cytophagaceae bacterium]
MAQNGQNGQNNFITMYSLPNATGSLTLGILSIVSFCCCIQPAGLIIGIIGIVLGVQAVNIYRSNPAQYTEGSYNNAVAGKVCSIIGVILNSTFVLVIIIKWALFVAIFTSVLDGTFDPDAFQF